MADLNNVELRVIDIVRTYFPYSASILNILEHIEDNPYWPPELEELPKREEVELALSNLSNKGWIGTTSTGRYIAL